MKPKYLPFDVFYSAFLENIEQIICYDAAAEYCYSYIINTGGIPEFKIYNDVTDGDFDSYELKQCLIKYYLAREEYIKCAALNNMALYKDSTINDNQRLFLACSDIVYGFEANLRVCYEVLKKDRIFCFYRLPEPPSDTIKFLDVLISNFQDNYYQHSFLVGLKEKVMMRIQQKSKFFILNTANSKNIFTPGNHILNSRKKIIEIDLSSHELRLN